MLFPPWLGFFLLFCIFHSYLFVAMIMISAIVIFFFLHHVLRRLYCIAMPISCHIALVIHVVAMSIMCIALILRLPVTSMLFVHQPLLSLSQAMPMYHHLPFFIPSCFFASDFIPSSINVHLFPDDLAPCPKPLCQISL